MQIEVEWFLGKTGTWFGMTKVKHTAESFPRFTTVLEEPNYYNK